MGYFNNRIVQIFTDLIIEIAHFAYYVIYLLSINVYFFFSAYEKAVITPSIAKHDIIELPP